MAPSAMAWKGSNKISVNLMLAIFMDQGTPLLPVAGPKRAKKLTEFFLNFNRFFLNGVSA